MIWGKPFEALTKTLGEQLECGIYSADIDFKLLVRRNKFRTPVFRKP